MILLDIHPNQIVELHELRDNEKLSSLISDMDKTAAKAVLPLQLTAVSTIKH